jgi:hypothetical protein
MRILGFGGNWAVMLNALFRNGILPREQNNFLFGLLWSAGRFNLAANLLVCSIG